MKSLKVKLSALALVVGIGAAFASTARQPFTNKKWGFNQGTGLYVEVTGLQSPGGYQCNSSANTCTAEYPADVNPNDQAHDSHTGTANPVNIVLGDFAQ